MAPNRPAGSLLGGIRRDIKRHGLVDAVAGRLSPSQVLALTFLGMIAVGTILLRLPVSHGDTSIGWLDSLFTATSAVCVTGLIVVDTGTAFSGFGQAVILVLFQLGGLGLLTFGTILALATGRRLGISERLRLAEQVRAMDLASVRSLVTAIIVTVVAAEGIGAALLYTRMGPREGTFDGMWHAVFHSISAFNNAGFSLNEDSLMGYAGDPVVNITAISLIVLGGLGFIVIVNLRERFILKRNVAISLHTRMAIGTSVFLVVAAAAALLVFEWHNPATIGEMGVFDRLQAILFQAVTPRTAGFNTLDIGSMVPASLVMIILLMFIGGSPGSTAGGIKTVTFNVLVLAVWNVLRGRSTTIVWGRRISHQTVIRASAIITGAVLVGGAALTLLALFEPDMDFMDLIFECVSALGTVGLSTGITAELSDPARMIIIFLMYMGRIGFLTFALALVTEQRPGRSRYLAEEVVIG